MQVFSTETALLFYLPKCELNFDIVQVSVENKCPISSSSMETCSNLTWDTSITLQYNVMYFMYSWHNKAFLVGFFFFFPLRWSHVSVKLKCIAPWADRESGGLNKIHMWLVIAAAYQMKGKKALTGAAQNSSCRSPAPGAPQPGSPCSPVPPHKVQPCRSPRGQRSRAAAGAPPAPTNSETLPSECACPLSHAEDTDLCKSRSKRNAFHSLRVAFVVVVSFFHLYRKKKTEHRDREKELQHLASCQQPRDEIHAKRKEKVELRRQKHIGAGRKTLGWMTPPEVLRALGTKGTEVPVLRAPSEVPLCAAMA